MSTRLNILFIAQFPYTWHGAIVDKFHERGCSCAVLSPKGICETASAEHFNLLYKLIDLPFALEHACQEFNPDLIVRSGQAGSKARAEKLSQEERTAIAKKAAARRWG